MAKRKKLQIRYTEQTTVQTLVRDIELHLQARRGLDWGMAQEMLDKMHHCYQVGSVLNIAKEYFDVTEIKL